jgi:hypothetical protein
MATGGQRLRHDLHGRFPRHAKAEFRGRRLERPRRAG